MKSLVLAGGFGTRLYPLTINQPKALLKYKDKPVINHIVDKIPEDMDILVDTNKKFESAFRQWKRTMGRKITLCIEPVYTEEQSLGAVGSLACWIKDINDYVLVFASDNYFGFDVLELLSAFDRKNTLVAVHDNGNESQACQFGVVRLLDGKIVELEEEPRNRKSSRYVATACYVFPQRVLHIICEFASKNNGANLGNLIAHLAIQDEVRAYVFSAPWFDIGTPDNFYPMVTSSSPVGPSA